MCISQLNNIPDYDLIIEPSAGGGAFIDILKTHNTRIISYDIEPAHPDIIKQDYLTVDVTQFPKNTLVIGNPPFGRQSSQAIKFLRHSEFASCIAFILPKSFKKDSMQEKLPMYFHLEHQIDIPEKAFVLGKDGNEHDVPCVFQIWKKYSYKRPPIKKIIPVGWAFTCNRGSEYIVFTRVGVNAGFCTLDDCKRPLTSHYLILLENHNDYNNHNEYLMYMVDQINNITWEFNNTVGPKSISKQELGKKLNEIIKHNN